jgi:hypothetical protein
VALHGTVSMRGMRLHKHLLGIFVGHPVIPVTVSAFLKMGTVTQAPVLAFACSNTGLRPVCNVQLQLVLLSELGTC